MKTIATRMHDPLSRDEAESKDRPLTTLDRAAKIYSPLAGTLLALFALLSSWYFNTYNGSASTDPSVRAAAAATHAAALPQLSYSLEELSFDVRNVKLRITARNSGGTTAICNQLFLQFHEAKEVAWGFKLFEGRVLPPREQTTETLRIARFQQFGDVTIDVVERTRGTGKIPFEMKYSAKGVSTDVLIDRLQFSSSAWHDKSIIGVGE